MKIAMPIENGRLSGHFGHAGQFAIVEVSDGNIKKNEILSPPPHEPGSLPRWLHEQGVTDVICGGIGPMAVELLQQSGIRVTAGVQADMDPAEAINALVAGNLKGATGPTCTGHEHGEGGHKCSHQTAS